MPSTARCSSRLYFPRRGAGRARGGAGIRPHTVPYTDPTPAGAIGGRTGSVTGDCPRDIRAVVGAEKGGSATEPPLYRGRAVFTGPRALGNWERTCWRRSW